MVNHIGDMNHLTAYCTCARAKSSDYMTKDSSTKYLLKNHYEPVQIYDLYYDQ